MRISYNWLNRYVDIDIPADELAELFIRKVAEIEEVAAFGVGLENVIAVKALEVKAHPNADKLHIVVVDTGESQMEIVCGAPNAQAGKTFALAVEGTKLSGGITVKKTTIRGVPSCGMLCSLRELGLGEDHSGIIELPPEAAAGTPISELFHLPDTVFVVDNKSLTHRPDLWGHHGIAREVSAILKKPLKNITADCQLELLEPTDATELDIVIEDAEKCPRYSAAVIQNIRSTDSPLWMQSLLMAAGQRPINNLVDITNFVNLEIGQPMHAFDREKLNGRTIRIRRARDGETLMTLDDTERKLLDEDLVIADETDAIALAGVMGGQSSEVDENTSSIVLESANFQPVTIRKTANRLGLRTEAATRFEKGQDPENTVNGIFRFVELLRETCPEADCGKGVLDRNCAPDNRKEICLDYDFVNRRIGVDVPADEVRTILQGLEFDVLESDTTGCRVRTPSFRSTGDVNEAIDLVEEIGRIYGHEKITEKAPAVTVKPVRRSPELETARKLRTLFSGPLGCHEIYCYSFLSAKDANAFEFSVDQLCELANPIAEDQEYLCFSLLPNILRTCAGNLRFADAFSLYQLGRTFQNRMDVKKGLPSESAAFTAVFVSKKDSDQMFFQAKGAAEQVLALFNIADAEIKPADSKTGSEVCPGRIAEIRLKKQVLGRLFQIHPMLLEAYDIEAEIAALELDPGALAGRSITQGRFQGVDKYPPVLFDLAVVVDERVMCSDVRDLILSGDRKFIREVNLFDVFQGKGIPKGKKSLAFSVKAVDPEGTISQKRSEKIRDRCIQRIEKAGHSLR